MHHDNNDSELIDLSEGTSNVHAFKILDNDTISLSS